MPNHEKRLMKLFITRNQRLCVFLLAKAPQRNQKRFAPHLVVRPVHSADGAGRRAICQPINLLNCNSASAFRALVSQAVSHPLMEAKMKCDCCYTMLILFGKKDQYSLHFADETLVDRL